MGLIGSDTRLLDVTWSKLPVERPVSRISRPVVLLSLVRAPAQPPQHASFGSRSHTPASRCLRFERRVAAPPARLAPVLLARLWTDQTCTGKLASASPIAPRLTACPLQSHQGTRTPGNLMGGKPLESGRAESLDGRQRTDAARCWWRTPTFRSLVVTRLPGLIRRGVTFEHRSSRLFATGP